jgi:hypothetical protein
LEQIRAATIKHVSGGNNITAGQLTRQDPCRKR